MPGHDIRHARGYNAIECDETLLGLVKDNGARLHAVCKGVGRVDRPLTLGRLLS